MNQIHTSSPTSLANPNKQVEHLSGNYGQIVSILLRKGHLTKQQIEYAVRIQSKLHSSKPLLTVIKELEYINDEQIGDMVGADDLSAVRIGDLLVELGLISETDLNAGLAIQSQEKPKRKLGEILIDHQFVEEKKLIEVLSLQLKIPIIEPEFSEIDRELFSRAPTRLYDDHNFIPIRLEDQGVLVVFSDPLDRQDRDAAGKFFGHKIVPAIATKQSIQVAIQQMQPKSMSKRFSDMAVSSPVDIVNSVILAAIKEKNVSDIHLEPMQDRFRVRFRMDGVLVHYKDFPLKSISGITSRIKIMCEADITEKRRHQGGRIFFEHDGRSIDLRVSFYVTVHGEKIVMRILNRQAELLSIKDIGMFPRMLGKFRLDALDCPSGVVIITGPTGSGKTTTVYSCINYLNKPDTSIITAEEPVEYIIEGISQCSINPKINLTFEETLRHIVRQDPDIIVIGEIRDTFSADVAVQAALTGHKVLTTFHTEDSIGGLIRLLNMDIDAFLISSTVVCVLAQRLLRKVCPDCARPYRITPEEILRLGYNANDIQGAQWLKGHGCSACRHTGYKGRVAVFELLTLNEPVRDGLLDQKTSHQIRKISIESTGLVTLLEDGIVKAASGITSIDEALRCLPRLQKPRPLEELQRLLGG